MKSIEADLIINKLRSALDSDGDFPTRGRVISEIQRLTEDPLASVDKVAEVIMTEPTLATRIIHLANSVYFARDSEIDSISQAIVQIGLKSIYNLVANFVLLQKFSPLAKQNEHFAQCLMMSMITSNLAAFLSSTDQEKDETGYLSGSLITIGPLLLGFYFPKLFVEATKRAERRKISMFNSIEDVLGTSAIEVSMGIIDSLSVPESRKACLNEAVLCYKNTNNEINLDSIEYTNKIVAFSVKIAELIIEATESKKLYEEIKDLSIKFNLNLDKVEKNLLKIPEALYGQSKLLDIGDIEVPVAFSKLLKKDFIDETNNIIQNSLLEPYLEQLENGIKDNETLASMIANATEAFSFALHFERVIYFESDTEVKNLKARLGLGSKLNDFSDLTIDLANSDADMLIKSFNNSSIETHGKTLFNDGWPAVCIPVGYNSRAIGLIYADFVDDGSNRILNPNDAYSLSTIADILDEAIKKRRE